MDPYLDIERNCAGPDGRTMGALSGVSVGGSVFSRNFAMSRTYDRTDGDGWAILSVGDLVSWRKREGNRMTWAGADEYRGLFSCPAQPRIFYLDGRST